MQSLIRFLMAGCECEPRVTLVFRSQWSGAALHVRAFGSLSETVRDGSERGTKLHRGSDRVAKSGSFATQYGPHFPARGGSGSETSSVGSDRAGGAS